MFQDDGCEIRKGRSRTLVAIGTRTEGNVYQIKGSGAKCFMSQINESKIWYRRMGHTNFDSLVKISSTNVVRYSKDYKSYQCNMQRVSVWKERKEEVQD